MLPPENPQTSESTRSALPVIAVQENIRRKAIEMIFPVQVTFHQMEPYPEAEAWVQEQAAKLNEFCSKIIRCHVTIDAPTRQGNPYQLHIDLTVPGKELVVSHEPSLYSSAQRLEQKKRVKSLDIDAPYKDLHLAIDRTFKAAQRQLEDYVHLERDHSMDAHQKE
jgi:ribosome-associated translation inhibitor RaiA